MSGTLLIYLRSAVRSLYRDPIEAQREECLVLVSMTLPERFGVQLAWAKRREYVDDAATDRSCLRRPAMSSLIVDAQRGDVVVMRDLSRISRDADERSATVKVLIVDRGTRLFTCDPAAEVFRRMPSWIAMSCFTVLSQLGELGFS